MVKVIIRRSLPNDAKLLSQLSERTFIDSFGHTCSEFDMSDFVARYFSEDRILEELSDQEDHYYLAFIDDFPVGYMRLKEGYEEYPAIQKYKAIELKRIYILKEYQSQKVGAALLQYAFQLGVSSGYEAIWLGVWEHNLRAIAFYKKYGFEDTDFTHSFFIGETGSTDHWLIKVF